MGGGGDGGRGYLHQWHNCIRFLSFLFVYITENLTNWLWTDLSWLNMLLCLVVDSHKISLVLPAETSVGSLREVRRYRKSGRLVILYLSEDLFLIQPGVSFVTRQKMHQVIMLVYAFCFKKYLSVFCFVFLSWKSSALVMACWGGGGRGRLGREFLPWASSSLHARKVFVCHLYVWLCLIRKTWKVGVSSS